MNIRLSFARILIQTGKLIESLAAAYMRPRDLMAFNRRMFPPPQQTREELNPAERELLKAVPLKSGHLLLLGPNGRGKTRILSEMGFKVTIIDNGTEPVETVKTALQESSSSGPGESGFDLVWLDEEMYSTLPTRKQRITLLKKTASLLKPGGYLLCQVLFHPHFSQPGSVHVFKKIVAFLTLGNWALEKGDIIQERRRFVHVFTRKTQVEEEFNSAGFEMNFLDTPPTAAWRRMVARMKN